MRHLNFTKWAPPKHCGDDWKKCVIDITKPFDPVDYIFEISGVPRLLQRGNITLLKGDAGCGKSAAGLLFMASMLSRDFGHLRATKDDFKMLWIDTEQAPATLGAKAQAVATMSDMSLSEVQKRVTVASVLSFSAAERLEYTCSMIEKMRPDFVLIDGVKDLCDNFNEVEPSEKTVNKILQVTVENNATTVAVIHTNKSDGNARGHIGAILEQKATEVYYLTKSGNTCCMEATKDRNGNNNHIAFDFHSNYTLSLIPPEYEPTPAELSRKLMQQVFGDDVIEDTEFKLSGPDMIKKICEIENVERSTANKRIKNAVALHVLEKTKMPGVKCYFYKLLALPANADFAGICDDDTPNDTPNDTPTKTAPEGLRQEEPKNRI
jgi:hypothetical protein